MADWQVDPSILEQVTVGQFLDLLSKYPIVTRKLLLIRPLRTGDGYTEFCHAAAELLKQDAQTGGWTVNDLAGNNATRAAVLNAIQQDDPDFVIHYGHSINMHNLSGQKNGQLEIAIGPGDAALLSGRSLSTVSCSTAKVLGPALISAKARAYLGYADLHTVYVGSGMAAEFTEASNAANLALLNGETYEVAYQIGRNAYDQKWLKWSSLQKQGKLTPLGKKICPLVMAALLKDRNGLTRLGNPRAVARPIGILLNPGS